MCTRHSGNFERSVCTGVSHGARGVRSNLHLDFHTVLCSALLFFRVRCEMVIYNLEQYSIYLFIYFFAIIVNPSTIAWSENISRCRDVKFLVRFLPKFNPSLILLCRLRASEQT